MKSLVPLERVEQTIAVIRGHRVMPDTNSIFDAIRPPVEPAAGKFRRFGSWT